MNEIGHRTWVFPAGRLPLTSTGKEPEFTSRDELCILNAEARDVDLEIEILRAEDEPLGPFTLTVAGRRIRHVRINDLMDPEPIPLDVPYGLIVRAGHPVVVQLMRTDTRQEALALTAMEGFGQD